MAYFEVSIWGNTEFPVVHSTHKLALDALKIARRENNIRHNFMTLTAISRVDGTSRQLLWANNRWCIVRYYPYP